LIDVLFKNNVARLRGGALNILQSPKEFSFNTGDTTGLGVYRPDKNPQLTNKDGSISIINKNIPKIDFLDESEYYAEPFGSQNFTRRQGLDDGRIAIFLGRMRRMTFDNNAVQLASVKEEFVNGVKRVYDNVDDPADYPYSVGNHAFGGAIYIAGVDEYKDRQIEVAFGLNHSIMIGGVQTFFNAKDEFHATKNEARDYQSSMNTDGARGGAIYVGKYTSLIIAGEFSNNRTYAKYFDDAQYWGSPSGIYSLGGAIFAENTLGRLQVRGEPSRETTNPTYFTSNSAGAGGAIYVDGNTSPLESPVIGGSDVTLNTRDYGFDIKFENNTALTYGGAVLSKRNMSINGSGGVEADAIIGYDGKYPVRFWNNSAGFSGGALDVRIPNAIPPLPAFQRSVKVIRAEFVNNTVGANVDGNNLNEIRGGGAVYAYNGELNIVKAVDFVGNTVYHGNGGAVSMVNLQDVSSKRLFLTDLDQITTDSYGQPVSYVSTNDPFTGVSQVYPADTRMLTRFLDNKILNPNDEFFKSQLGTGTTQIGQGTPLTKSTILATKWLNDNTGFVVGMDGLLIRLTNGGTTWQYLNSGSTYRITDIEFVTPQVGFIAGDRGVIRKTTDGGTTWFALNSGTDKQINDIVFIGSNLGYAVTNGGNLLKTTDGGSSWTVKNISMLDLNSVFFTSSNTGYICGDNAEVFFTTDGNNWQVRDIIGTNEDLNAIYFLNATKGFIFGKNGVGLSTSNSGVTWDLFPTGTTNTFNKIFFTSQQVGFAVGDGGIAYKTINGGTNWVNMTTGSTYGFHSVDFPSQNTGYIVGDAGLIIKTKDAGATWSLVEPTNKTFIDVVRKNQDCFLAENGIGLGGAIYILDSVTASRVGRTDSIQFNRVKIQNNEAFTGSAIYSDNYDLKLILNRSMVTGNIASSLIGMEQNVITGPIDRDNGGNINHNTASSDLVGTTIYGEVQGPLPAYNNSIAANSIYNNNARFLIRLPDAPNSKGILAGTTGLGYGGTDTLRGNYWGHTEANVSFTIPHLQNNKFSTMETFFIAGDGNSWLPFVYPELINANPADPRKKGPFESVERNDVKYIPITLKNIDDLDESTPDLASIPEKLVFSGRIYDIYDKGTDIKTADYSKRRMSPIEDFAVGIPPKLRTFDVPSLPSYGKVVRRWTRNPESAEMTNSSGDLKYAGIAAVQTEFKADINGVYYHPIGYPLYLEAKANYEDLIRRSNHDPRILNESVFFVINLKTGDFIRTNLKQVDEDAPYRETFRSTVELVPDSSFRTDPTWRRTSEGLANLGSGPELLDNLLQNAFNEDYGTLKGRRYSADDNALGRVPNLFSNRPTMPVSNLISGTSWTTFFAGERYQALPVRVGDSVLIVSRTILWREGIHSAAVKGIAFRITESTEPPVFTGDIVKLKTDTIRKRIPSEDNPNVKVDVVYTEFLNKVFLTEDRHYPVDFATYSGLDLYGDPSGDLAGGRGRDSILNITAIDTNRFYDGRSFLEPANYARLTYGWTIHPASALSRWLIVNKKTASNTIKDGALGYLELAGRPINPFIVPGGDSITVTASNFPPNYRTYDALLSMNPPLTQDEIDQWIETFPSYLHAMAYDVANARFLQQDTINVGPNITTSYTFKIFVVDSMPRFIEPEETPEDIFRQDDPSELYVRYTPSDYKCQKDRNGRLVANLTDKLRFQIDINTDDELEDKSPSTQGWDFRYGRTAYGFMNKAIRMNPEDTTIFDEIDYTGDPLKKWPAGTYIVQSRPDWMANKYLNFYDKDDQNDEFGTNFTTDGQINIRIPKSEALSLLEKDSNATYNEAYNTDTVFTVVVNDGHGGINSQMYGVFINIQPEIVTETLPFAVEDYDYNPTLLDPSKMIVVKDPNFGQKMNYRLIYSTTPENQLRIDECFEDAGFIDLTGIKSTPLWLKINPNTGLLYGTPRVKDAPDSATITVVVTDENGLRTMKRIPLEVRPVTHNPVITGIPQVDCIDPNTPYSTTLKITDTDLNRVTNPNETITLKLLDYLDQPLAGMSVNPSSYVSTGTTDNFDVTITKTGALQADPDGKVTIKLIVDDAFGNSTQLVFRLNISQPTDFVAKVTITNTKGSTQDLIFGTSSVTGTSTGDGNDNEYVGKLDEDLCEVELPPVPFEDVFDARWTITNRNGVLRNIFPTAQPQIERNYIYKGQFQAGGVMGGSSPLYPVTISWDPNEVPAINDNVKNPAGSTWYL
jgi:predicted outer membrane repeat protein